MTAASLLLLLQVAAAPSPASPAFVPQLPMGDSSASARALVTRVRAAETQFLMVWRDVWKQSFGGVRPDQARLTAIHCHYDGGYEGGSPNLIHPPGAASLKSWCPIWYSDTTRLRGDIRTGVDYALSPYAETLMRRHRADLLALIDSAAVADPKNLWIAGQRVRMDLDQGRLDSALAAAQACTGATAWCGMLTGYARYESGELGAADSTFLRALRAMPFTDRCDWTDISMLLPQPEQAAYLRLSCAERAAVNDRFWWLANPLMSEPGNERRTEQFAREVFIALRDALTVDEWSDWRPTNGREAASELILRYGVPSYSAWGDSVEDARHFTWMGFTDSSLNVSAEYSSPRFHTIPPWHAIADPMTLTQSDWAGLTLTRQDHTRWPVEHYARDAGPLIGLPSQVAVLRRDRSALVAVALKMPESATATVDPTAYIGSLILSTGPRDTTHAIRRPVDPGHTVVLTGSATEGVVVSAEIVPANGVPGAAGRSRFAVVPPSPLSDLRPGEVALSDVVLFQPPASEDSLPLTTIGALPRMFPSTHFRGVAKIGLFWEVYGLGSNDTVDVAIRVAQVERPNFIRRLKALVGLDDGTEAVSMHWKEPEVARTALTRYEGRVPVQSRAVVVDVSRLTPGQYLTEVIVTRRGQPPVTTKRALTIDPP